MEEKQVLRKLEEMFRDIRLEKQEEHMRKVHGHGPSISHKLDRSECDIHGRRDSTSSQRSSLSPLGGHRPLRPVVVSLRNLDNTALSRSGSRDSVASTGSRKFSIDSLEGRRDSLDMDKRNPLSGGAVLDDGTILEEEEVGPHDSKVSCRVSFAPFLNHKACECRLRSSQPLLRN
ncbi:unnamed protein product [Darwinula stevensoni]|uniref:Uncharacterized protein n=1 Tax=Darwinula stevensoni TaxID=69355 RepID=A0A7R8X1J2_9CRUS|nr:unnamed protein product [Darwinula stevensoni]CAG0880079.1 unnamed protein product [Darwinula stevensoni]